MRYFTMTDDRTVGFTHGRRAAGARRCTNLVATAFGGRLLLPLLFLALSAEAVVSRAGETQSTPKPAWSTIQTTVDGYFTHLPDFKPGNLISRSEGATVVAELKKAGFAIPQAQAILARVPDDNEFLITRLRKRDGRVFMQKISKLPQGYDRVDRLLRLSNGQTMVNDLIRGPGGDELIRYMTTAPGGRQMGRQLAAAPGGEDFNQPTGRIYTAPQLLHVLKDIYEGRDPFAAAEKPTASRAR